MLDFNLVGPLSFMPFLPRSNDTERCNYTNEWSGVHHHFVPVPVITLYSSKCVCVCVSWMHLNANHYRLQIT